MVSMGARPSTTQRNRAGVREHVHIVELENVALLIVARVEGSVITASTSLATS